MANQGQEEAKAQAHAQPSSQNDQAGATGASQANGASKESTEGGGGGRGSGGGGQRGFKENLMTRMVALDNKSYFLDVRENARGRYLKLSEASARYRNTILLPGNAVRILLSVLNDAIKEDYTSKVDVDNLESSWVTIFSKSTTVGQKKIYFDLMQNNRGRSINVAEIHPYRPKSAVLLADKCWFEFRRALNDVLQVLAPESEGEEEEAEEEYYYTITDNSNAIKPDANTGGASIIASKRMQLRTKRFFFDLRENDQGRYCKVTEIHRSNRESVYLPVSIIPTFVSLLQVLIAEEYHAQVEGCEEAELPEQENENHTTLVRRVIPVEDDRRFILDLRENQYGQFLRICEEKARSSYVFMPSECFEGFRDVLDEFAAI